MPRSGPYVEERPFQTGAAITPSDSTVLEGIVAIYVGGTGSLSIEGQDGADYTLAAVPAGTLLRVEPAKVNATGTTATNLVGLRI